LRLSELLDDGNVRRTGEDVEIRGLTADSRAIKPGYLFAALNGLKARGADYIGDATRQGAVAVLTRHDVVIPSEVGELAHVTDDHPRRRLALMAARFYGTQPKTIAAVTGTNGKSSTVSFARQIWQLSGRPAASMGSLGVEADGARIELQHTTPDPVALHRALAELARRGIDHVALEASSHGLDQHRLDGVTIRAAAFTNLTRDHFDYHGTAERYLEAKLRLFKELMGEGGVAVLNADVPEYEILSRVCRARGHRILSFGRKGRDLKLASSTPSGAGQRLRIEFGGMSHEIEIVLPGAFQASNLLAAIGLTLASGLTFEAVLNALPRVLGVQGRLQAIPGHPREALIFVDYAHTPDALATALTALRPYARARLVALFGCGGDRDRGKRPLMGEIAGRLADAVIVTDDNPRSEDPAAIRHEICAACPNAEEIGDRARAIHAAVRQLQSGDVLLIAGKGHERGQIVGDRTIPFDDADCALDAVRALAGGRA
jgi:UDP-N-acetylmuramoyl-L-alanyl-D-glutamate--2,6-diaminopimelate ligase